MAGHGDSGLLIVFSICAVALLLCCTLCIFYQLVGKWEINLKDKKDHHKTSMKVQRSGARDAADTVDLLEGGRSHTNWKEPFCDKPIIEHRVKDGDTLPGILMHYDVTMTMLKRFNDFPGDSFKACKVLRIPSKNAPMDRIVDPDREGIRRVKVMNSKFQMAARRKLNATMATQSSAVQEPNITEQNFQPTAFPINMTAEDISCETSEAQARFYLTMAEDAASDAEDEQLASSPTTSACNPRSASEDQWSERENELLVLALAQWWDDLQWEARAKPAEAFPNLPTDSRRKPMTKRDIPHMQQEFELQSLLSKEN